jgi:hypothetical protein
LDGISINSRESSYSDRDFDALINHRLVTNGSKETEKEVHVCAPEGGQAIVGPQPNTVDSRSYVKVVKEGSMNRDLVMSTPDGAQD